MLINWLIESYLDHAFVRKAAGKSRAFEQLAQSISQRIAPDDFIGLSGTEEELIAAQEAAAVPVAFIDSEFEGGYTVAHAGWIFLYTQADLTHLRSPSGVRQSAWAHDLELLVREGWPAS